MLKTFATAIALSVSALPAQAVTKTFTWTWPTTRTDGSAMAQSSIGGFTLFDTSAPAPGAPGTVVPCPTTIPPTTPTGTCQANVTTGHSFDATYSDNSVPPQTSATSNVVAVPLSAPAAITDLKVQ